MLRLVDWTIDPQVFGLVRVTVFFNNFIKVIYV